MDTNQRYRDNAKNAFAKSNLFYSSGSFLGIQDPTVFGFKLFFHFDNIDSPLLYGAVSDINEAPRNTAANYLKTIKDEQRLYYLEKFLYLLSNVNAQTPWYFQSLTGLKDAWAMPMDKPFIGADKKLEIECLESIDLRVTALMDLYRKACYDWKHRREVVPKNLRQFKVSVYVYEARMFGNPNSIATAIPEEPVDFGYGGNIQGEAAKKNAALVSRLLGTDETRNDPITSDVNLTEGVQMSTTRNLFHFDFCEFDMSTATHLDTISNMEPTEVKQKISIKYQDFEEENMYHFWTSNDPVTSAYVRTLDRQALDDPQFQEPGVPVASTDTPNAQPTNTSQQTPSGNDEDIRAEGKRNNERLSAAKIRQKIQDAFESVANNTGERAASIGENTFLGDLGNQLANQAIGNAQNAANALISGLFLGNIYGLSAGTLLGESGAQRVAASILDAGASIVNKPGKPQSVVFDPNANSNGANSTPDGAELGNQFEGSRGETPNAPNFTKGPGTNSTPDGADLGNQFG